MARQRLGADADLHLADVGSPLPFTDGAFDDVIASLVLHYLEDWTAPLAEDPRKLRQMHDRSVPAGLELRAVCRLAG